MTMLLAAAIRDVAAALVLEEEPGPIVRPTDNKLRHAIR
jgi:hypothetical protein